MTRKAIAAVLVLCAGSAALHAQPAPQTTRFTARNFTVMKQAPLIAAEEDKSMLRTAKLRPQALQLRASLGRLSLARVNLAVLDRSRVPVLISARAELLTNLKVFAATDRYTASTKQNGVVIEINGTRLPTTVPNNFRMPRMTPLIQLNNAPAPAPSPSNLPMRRSLSTRALRLTTTVPAAPGADALRNVSIDHTGYGVDISFTRFGSVYNVTVDCGGSEAQDPEAIGPAEQSEAPPASDACTDDKALGLAKELEVAGGGEASP